MEYDYLIIGQGLAGSCFALKAIERGKKILVLDTKEYNHSSMVAAGLYNPITGKNWVKTWLADTIFPEAENFYLKYEKILNSKFLYRVPIYRPFPNNEMQNEWMGKTTDQSYSPFISKVTIKSQFEFLNDPLGGIYLKQSGRLDVSMFINKVRDYLKQRSELVDSHFDFENFDFGSGSSFQFNGDSFKKIISTEGPDAGQNTYWQDVRFKLVKGEVLEIQTDLQRNINVIPNKGVFMVPLSDEGWFKVGSTYEHKDLSLEPSQKGRSQIVEKLDNLFSEKYVIKKQIAGIRPAVIDRRPVLGQHPEVSNLYIFNGLGAKGVTLSPYFAEHLLYFIEFGKELRREVDIKRFL